MSTISSSSAPESLRAFIASPKQLLIDGKWLSAKSEKTFDVFDPATDQVVAAVAEGDATDVELAVAAGTPERLSVAEKERPLKRSPRGSRWN